MQVGSYTYPTEDAGDTLVCIPRNLIPILRHGISELQRRYWWASYGDWFRGYQALAAFEEGMTMADCMADTNDRLDRLYRLLDSSLNGTEYTDNAGIISPELPSVPPASVSAPNAMRAHVGRIWHLAENATTGQTAAAGAGIEGAAALSDDDSTRTVLRRLIAGIDGNTDPAPADNLLKALRGTVVADTDRNVVTLIDQLENLLTEIRDKLQ